MGYDRRRREEPDLDSLVLSPTVPDVSRFRDGSVFAGRERTMYARDDTTPTDRTDPDHYERSPSTGAEETARILDARDGYDHEPPTDDADPVTIDATGPADVDPAPSREVFA